jgi:hypothetical protein
VKAVLRNIRAARLAGADAAVVMSPQFLAFSQEQLTAYCLAIADASDLPLEVYHHLRMPTPFAIETVARLAAHPNIVGLKDTNGGDPTIAVPRYSRQPKASRCSFSRASRNSRSPRRGRADTAACSPKPTSPRGFTARFSMRGDADVAFGRSPPSPRPPPCWGIFLRPEVRQSFCHFLHTLKLPAARARGFGQHDLRDARAGHCRRLRANRARVHAGAPDRRSGHPTRLKALPP